MSHEKRRIMVSRTANCGIVEIYGLEGPAEAIVRQLAAWCCGYWDRPAIVIFHDAVEFGNGARLSNYLRKNKLGWVTQTPLAYNVNSGKTIRLWAWRLNDKASNIIHPAPDRTEEEEVW